MLCYSSVLYTVESKSTWIKSIFARKVSGKPIHKTSPGLYFNHRGTKLKKAHIAWNSSATLDSAMQWQQQIKLSLALPSPLHITKRRSNECPNCFHSLLFSIVSLVTSLVSSSLCKSGKWRSSMKPTGVERRTDYISQFQEKQALGKSISSWRGRTFSTWILPKANVKVPLQDKYLMNCKFW